MLGNLKDLAKMQKMAKDIQKKLGNIHVEAEEEGVIIVIDGNLKVVSVQITEEAYEKGVEHLQISIQKAIDKGMKKAQEIAAQNMKDLMGGMGMPSIPGMGK